MIDRRKFFSTEELHRLHPMLGVRDGVYDGKQYVVFSGSCSFARNPTAEWPGELEMWVEHEHELGVDGEIYDPLRFYFDRRGLTEALTGSVYGKVGTMAEVLVQQLFGGYFVDVMFGEWVQMEGLRQCLFVRPPSDIETALRAGSKTQCVMIRITEDRRKCALSCTSFEPCNALYHRIQFADDGYRRYEFILHPLLDDIHSTSYRENTILVKNYVRFYAAMYESCIMSAHHDQSWRELHKK